MRLRVEATCSRSWMSTMWRKDRSGNRTQRRIARDAPGRFAARGEPSSLPRPCRVGPSGSGLRGRACAVLLARPRRPDPEGPTL